MSENLDIFLKKLDETLGSEEKLYPDQIALQKILPSILLLQNHKEKFYGESWRKYGDVSAFFNTARKWDRIETIMSAAMKEGTDKLFDGSSDLSTETILDTVIDLGLYSLMWASYIADRYPQLWDKFIQLNELKTEADG
jgi:hypothetical protein